MESAERWLEEGEFKAFKSAFAVLALQAATTKSPQLSLMAGFEAL